MWFLLLGFRRRSCGEEETEQVGAGLVGTHSAQEHPPWWPKADPKPHTAAIATAHGRPGMAEGYVG